MRRAADWPAWPPIWLALGQQNVTLSEALIPVRPSTRHAADMLGLDPLEVANEGKVVIVVRRGCGRAGAADHCVSTHEVRKPFASDRSRTSQRDGVCCARRSVGSESCKSLTENSCRGSASVAMAGRRPRGVKTLAKRPGYARTERPSLCAAGIDASNAAGGGRGPESTALPPSPARGSLPNRTGACVMTSAQLETLARLFLPRRALEELIQRLRSLGYTVIGPTIVDNVVSMREITSTRRSAPRCSGPAGRRQVSTGEEQRLADV